MLGFINDEFLTFVSLEYPFSPLNEIYGYYHFYTMMQYFKSNLKLFVVYFMSWEGHLIVGAVTGSLWEFSSEGQWMSQQDSKAGLWFQYFVDIEKVVTGIEGKMVSRESLAKEDLWFQNSYY